ncbi:MAG: hypothetical protein WCX61_02960 [Candidatus Peribacteraceae bacterium]|jgi:plastocyanin
MPNLHPHWQPTDDENEIPVRAASSARAVNVNAATVSRKPAAIVGMMIVIALGTVLFQGATSLSLRGSIRDDVVTVRITSVGLDPQDITVNVGTTIRWVNDQPVPHIIVADTLCDADDNCLVTPTIFSGEEVEFTITADIPAGTYPYSSATTASIQGTITVGTPSAVFPTTIDNDVLAESSVADDDALPVPKAILVDSPSAQEQTSVPSVQVVQPTTTADDPIPARVATQQIPTNPNTVSQRSAAPISTADVSHAGAPDVSTHKPFTQPQTGPRSWFILVASVALLLLISRRILVWK